MQENTLKVLRAKNNLSQQELADKIGVSRQTISSIERGKTPTLTIALALAHVLNTDVFKLIKEDQDAK